MHIPDGFLNGRTTALTGILSAAALGWAVRHTRVNLPPRKVPLMGLSAAFVFAAMMLQFPVAAGTSGHLIGGVMCSVLLGPSAAVLVITSVLIVQCFLFADGGLLALGANVFNMAVICSVGGYYIYRFVHRLLPGARGRLVAVAFASWSATVLASIACAGELAASGKVAWSVAFPAMTGVHMLIGIGEAIITTLVIFTIAQSQPDLLDDARAIPTSRPYGEVLVFGALIAIGLAVFVSPFACPWPDGLEHMARAIGLEQHAISAPIPDYQFPGIKSAGAATSLAGLIGTVLAFGLGLVMARVLIPTQPAIDTNASEQGPANA